MTRMRDLRERILERVAEQDGGYSSPCWISDRATNGVGYTQIWVGQEKFYTHRLAYQIFVGPIPDGLHIDHLCRQRACCNPVHLEPVTPRENVLRGNSPAAAQALQTECIHGHPFDEANTGRTNGKRYCHECNRASCRRRYAAGTK
jgi:hypothetical protein